MNPSVLFVFILSALLGVLRAADLAFGTDAVTGLCLVGSVWWRYLALGIVVLAAVFMGRTQPSHSETVRSRRPLAGVLAFVGAVCFLAAAGAQIALGAASGLGGFVRCILECLCSAWLIKRAALVFLAALARALHVPQPGNDKTLCAAGLAAFALGLCWQLPQCFALLAGNGMDLAVMPDFFAGLGLCCVGSIGGVCAAACLNRQS